MKISYCTCKTITDCFGLNELLLQSWTCYRKFHFCLWVWSLMKPGWLRQATCHASRRHWNCILLAVLKLLQAYRQCNRPEIWMPVLTDTTAHHHWNTIRKQKNTLNYELGVTQNTSCSRRHSGWARLSSSVQGAKLFELKQADAGAGWAWRGNFITIEQTNLSFTQPCSSLVRTGPIGRANNMVTQHLLWYPNEV